MPQLRLIRVFCEVARAGSFTAAARNLGLSKSSVSKHVASLEQSLGVVLLQRSTHNLCLTDAGQSLLDGGLRLLDDYHRLEIELRDSVQSLRGDIRIGVPPAFGSAHLVPATQEFTRQYPETRVDLLLDDGTLDIIRDNLDLTLRIAVGLKDASHISRLLARVPQCLVASPQYIGAHGEPRELDDLRHHNCLIHSAKSPTDVWRFCCGDTTVEIPVRGSIRANFGPALLEAALNGAGISMHPSYMVSDDIAKGRLQVVLADAPAPVHLRIYAIYANRNTPELVRRFIDFLASRRWQ